MKVGLVVTLSLLLVACNLFAFSVGPVGEALRKELREKESIEVDLKKIVPFDWDEFYLFTPYTPREEVCKRLQLTELHCWYYVPTESTVDGLMFLAFRYKGKTVHTEMHSRFNGDFTPVDYPQPVLPERGRFVVKKDGVTGSGEPWLRLRPIAEAKRSN